MRVKKRVSVLTLLTSFALLTQAFAGDTVLKNISISGFVDTSYSANVTTGQTTFTLDQFEVDIEKKLEGVGSLRVDVNFPLLSDDASTSGVDESRYTADDILEQGYITIDKGPVSFLFGKFNAPIGFELLDAPDMFQFSHAMVFDFGLPTNLTGADISGSFGVVDLNVYVSNGWDKIVDDNNEVTLGGRLGITPVEGINFGLSYIFGDETGAGTWTSAENLSVFDADFTCTLLPDLTLGAEINVGKHEKNSALKPGVDDAKWVGYLVMANYGFSDALGLTLRYDAFSDSDGARLGGGVDETRQSFTISPSLTIGDGFGGLFEYRYTSSDQDVFLDSDGKATGSESALAVEFTYSF